MSRRGDRTEVALAKFGTGQPVSRIEDPKRLRGAGRYTDDIHLAGQAHAVMVRSRQAHGTIRAIDVAEARRIPGVLGVYTAADIAAPRYGAIRPGIVVPNRDGTPMRAPPRPAFPPPHVRFVGEAVAFVVAETASIAQDAAAAGGCGVDPPPAVTSPRAPPAPGGPQHH